MDETEKKVFETDIKTKVLESPKPVAFTVDFDDKPLDTAKYKNLVEKYKHLKHRRGQSLSKIETTPKPPEKKTPLTGYLPRKSGYNAEGYLSSEETKFQGVKSSVLTSVIKKKDLTLPLKSLNDRMTQSFPSRSFDLPVIDSPEIEIKDISSPELDAITPISPVYCNTEDNTSKNESSSSDEVIVDKFQSCIEISDNISEAGTYTIETDNYTEEQKARMSIDKDFNIEHITVQKKTQEYLQNIILESPIDEKPKIITSNQTSPVSLNNKTKVLNSQQRSKSVDSPSETGDRGVFTLVTTSGVLNKQQTKSYTTSHNLVKSVVALETYPSNLETSSNGVQRINGSPTTVRSITQTLFAQNISVIDTEYCASNPSNSVSNSPKKISPLHTARNRNSYSSANCDLSDSSLETESYLQPTKQIISSLQKRLSLDSDSDNDRKYNLPLNNEAKLLIKHKPVHVRHNSFDDRNIKLTNKLEHFHNKNLQGIDQTLKTCNQYKLQNSPNNSPIRRSSSFSLKNQYDNQQKYLNMQVKDNNYNRKPNSSSSIQRSSSNVNIKPKTEITRRSSTTSDSQERNHETESSSEEDYLAKTKKDLTTTRYNRAFSLRRARLDVEPPKCPKTPEMKRKFAPERTVSVDRKGTKSADVSSRYMNLAKPVKSAQTRSDAPKNLPKAPTLTKQAFSRTDSGRFSLRNASSVNNKPLTTKKDSQGKFNNYIHLLISVKFS